MVGGWAPGGAATSERGAVPGEGLARAGRWRGAKGAFQELWSEQETPRWVGEEAVLSPKGALLWGGWGDRGPPRLCPFEPLEEGEAAGKRPGPQPGALGPPPTCPWRPASSWLSVPSPVKLQTAQHHRPVRGQGQGPAPLSFHGRWGRGACSPGHGILGRTPWGHQAGVRAHLGMSLGLQSGQGAENQSVQAPHPRLPLVGPSPTQPSAPHHLAPQIPASTAGGKMAEAPCSPGDQQVSARQAGAQRVEGCRVPLLYGGSLG